MARDYAKYNTKRKGSSTNRLVWLLSVIVFLIILGTTTYWFYKHKLPSMMADQNQSQLWTNIKKLFHKKEPHSTVNATPAEASNQEDVHFDFYDELPNLKVKTVTAAPASTTTVATEVTKPADPKKVIYTLELGRFDDENEAAGLRVSLLLAGIEAELVKVDNKYYIHQGRYSSMDSAKSAQSKLQKKGVESRIVSATQL